MHLPHCLRASLRQRFILEPADLLPHLAALDDRCDLDGRWRVAELYCGNDTWRAAVQALMARSELVAVDLCGFGPDHQGCRFELQALVDLVPAERVALLVDQTTDLDFLAPTLTSAAASSPGGPAAATMARVSLDDGEAAVVDELLRRAAGTTGARA